MLKTLAAYRAEVHKTAQYLDTYDKESTFINIVKSHANNQPNMNLTFKTLVKVVQEFNQTKDKQSHKRLTTYKSKTEEMLNKKLESKIMPRKVY